MKKLLFAFVVLLLAGCLSSAPRDSVTQTSTIDALLAGVYDGEMTRKELLRHGDLGIGTFEGLDGEMVVADGVVYQVRADGRVYRPSAKVRTPFAAVTFFEPEAVVDLSKGMDYRQLQAFLDKQIGNPHLFYAFRIDGCFSRMHTRSVPAQSKPYPPLSEVTKNQPEFAMSDIDGTIVGFRCPVYVKGINVPGYHLHFISKDRRRGGHILDFTLLEGRAEIDTSHRFVLIMPRNVAAMKNLDLSLDRGGDLEKVEQ